MRECCSAYYCGNESLTLIRSPVPSVTTNLSKIKNMNYCSYNMAK